MASDSMASVRAKWRGGPQRPQYRTVINLLRMATAELVLYELEETIGNRKKQRERIGKKAMKVIKRYDEIQRAKQ